MEAKISEIFMSYQGEGSFAGHRQLFVRFYGCNISCEFCDTPLENYKTFTIESLMSKIMDFDDNYSEIALTGGEPLLHADFINEFVSLYTKHRKHKIYLESNGTLPDELSKVVSLIDIIAMDIKLPSSTKDVKDFWKMHKDFINIAIDKKKELIVKAVITGDTVFCDIQKMVDTLCGIKEKYTIVIQPVTPGGVLIKKAEADNLNFFKGYVQQKLKKETLLLGQMHKYAEIR